MHISAIALSMSRMTVFQVVIISADKTFVSQVFKHLITDPVLGVRPFAGQYIAYASLVVQIQFMQRICLCDNRKCPAVPAQFG
jgi:hypothetical protein